MLNNLTPKWKIHGPRVHKIKIALALEERLICRIRWSEFDSNASIPWQHAQEESHRRDQAPMARKTRLRGWWRTSRDDTRQGQAEKSWNPRRGSKDKTSIS